MFSPVAILVYYTLIFYLFTPLYIYLSRGNNEALRVVEICFFSNLFLLLGYYFKSKVIFSIIPKIAVDPLKFTHFVFVLFFIFCFYTFYSFGGVPLISIIFDLGNADLLRGQLFKGREGSEIVLLYLSAIFSYVFVPLAVVITYHFKSPLRNYYLASAVVFSVVTLQKALVLNIIFPLFAYLFLKGKIGAKFAVNFCFVLFVYFIVMIQITGHSSSEAINTSDFFTSSYVPSGAVDYFGWRFFAVPIYTAIDSIYVFENWLGSQHLMGASSSLLSSLFGLQKIELEKLVFEYQFGGYNPLANANAYWAVSMYLDFSWWGICIFSTLLGVLYASMRQSNDLSIYSIGYLLTWQAANGSLIGIMLSSGFLYIVFHLIFIRFKYKGSYVS